MFFFNDVDTALYRSLMTLNALDNKVTVRGAETKEVLLYSFAVTDPLQRIVFNKERKGNIFAQIAETLWMLAGRDDLDWLETYIPQCKKWSDDGETWRAAYGPRLRNWRTAGIGEFRGLAELSGGERKMMHVDQIAEVINKLKADPHTRQAVISLWDPAQDWVEGSKDYPCNNWLHFIIRDGQLHLNVSIRSNDLIYGFSHVDFFSWSVLQQLVAHWVGVGVGMMGWNVTSMHVYKRHYAMMDRLIDEYIIKHRSLTDNPKPPTLEPEVDFEEIDSWLSINLNNKPLIHRDVNATYTPSGLLTTMKRMLTIYKYYKQFVTKDEGHERNLSKLHTMVMSLPECDMKTAAELYFHRIYPETFLRDVL